MVESGHCVSILIRQLKIINFPYFFNRQFCPVDGVCVTCPSWKSNHIWQILWIFECDRHHRSVPWVPEVRVFPAHMQELVQACVVQTGRKRLIKAAHATVSQDRSRLSTSTRLMKCQSRQRDGWRKRGKEKLGRERRAEGGREGGGTLSAGDRRSREMETEGRLSGPLCPGNGATEDIIVRRIHFWFAFWNPHL